MCKKFNTEEELINFTNKLLNKRVKDVFTDEQINSQNINNKGKLGHLIEKFYFEYDLNNQKSPDFSDIGVELKVSPINILKNGNYSPKERIKLTQLNLNDVINNKNIKDSETWNKIKKTLIIWYVNSKEFNNNQFKIIKLLELEKQVEFKEIENDWIRIREIIKNGEAHKISESTTNYLGLARNGTGKNEKKISQPFSEEKFYKRAFTLKTKFLRKILQINEDIFDIHSITKEIIGKTIGELALKNNVNIEKRKDFAAAAIAKYFDATKFGKLSDKIYEENGDFFTFKTISLTKMKDDVWKINEEFGFNLNIIEDMRNNNEWIDSNFSKAFENKFIIFLYEFDRKNRSKSKIIDVKEITFDDDEINEIKKTYEEFRYRYHNGELVDGNKNVNFIKKSDNKKLHIRPGARDSKDTFTTPTGEVATKCKIWANKEMIYKKIFTSSDEKLN